MEDKRLFAEGKHTYIYPSVRVDKGTVVDGNRRTMHVKCQTIVRKEWEGKYYEWPILSRRSAGWISDGQDIQMEDLVRDTLADLHKTAYTVLVTGIVNTDIRDEDSYPIYPEWQMHPHSITEKERIDYLCIHIA
jgi:hypothetical protein